MARLIAYLREPAADGRAERLGRLAAQREAVEAWAAPRRRHRIVSLIEDRAGAELEDRPGLTQAMLALAAEDVDGVVVPRLAALHPDVVTQEQILEEVRRAGARVFAVEPADEAELRARPTDSYRQIVRRVLLTASQNEPSLFALRSAMRAPSGGSPPYGYQKEDGQLVPEPAEQATIARIAELRGAGTTLREIARVLDAEGHRPKRGAQWHPEAVRRIASRGGPAETCER